MQPFYVRRPAANVRFGWFDVGHHAILAGAQARLTDSPLKRYVSGTRQVILNEDDTQDLCYAGPKHYMDIEQRGNFRNKNISALVRTQDKPSPWAVVSAKFVPKNLYRLEEDWITRPLLPNTIGHPQTLYHSILHAYRKVREQFQTIAQGNKRLLTVAPGNGPRDQELHRIFYDNLSRSIGVLAHYVGDLFMPLHVTQHFDWPLLPHGERGDAALAVGTFAFKDGIHFFSEGQVLKPGDYQAVAQAKKHVDTRTRLNNEGELTSFVLSLMQNSMRKVFEMVRLQKAALAGQQDVKNPAAYQAQLAAGLKPLLLSQLRAAQIALAVILQSAWHEAGRPDLPQVTQGAGGERVYQLK